MLHNEVRELMVKAYEEAHNAKEVAKCFGVDRMKLSISLDTICSKYNA